MASTIYETGTVTLIDGTSLYLTPLKIKYLRQFMHRFEDVKQSKNDDEAITKIVDCVLISMQQYAPHINTVDLVEDNFDLNGLYKVLEVGAGVKMTPKEENVPQQAAESGPSWDELDLAKLESEVFLLGIWKDYEELEVSLSMPELMSVLTAKREEDYTHKKFLAAIQGVDLDKESGRASNAWEDMKARVFSGGKTGDATDIVSMQGINAQKAGFGIGLGLDYEDLG